MLQTKQLCIYIFQELTHLLSSLSLSGSLPYMGNTDSPKDTSHPEEAEIKITCNKAEDDFVEKPVEKPTQDQASYLNLSPNKGRPVPIKRSVF